MNKNMNNNKIICFYLFLLLLMARDGNKLYPN